MTVNIFGEEWDGGRDRPGWQWKRLPVAERLGAKQIGASLYELAPGQRTFPYHWHQLEEEWSGFSLTLLSAVVATRTAGSD